MYRKKLVWLVILMVWVGMVTSIVLYQEDYNLVSQGVNSDSIEIIESNFNGNENVSENLNYTHSVDSNDDNFFF